MLAWLSYEAFADVGGGDLAGQNIEHILGIQMASLWYEIVHAFLNARDEQNVDRRWYRCVVLVCLGWEDSNSDANDSEDSSDSTCHFVWT